MAKLSPVFNDAQLIDGVPASGAKVFTYAAGSTTKQTTFTDEAGTTPQANPIILNVRGEPDNPIHLTEGLNYKFVFAPSTDNDPPTSAIRTVDNVAGVNDTAISASQWVDSGTTPTFVSGTQFTVPGDKVSDFQVDRRVKISVTAGTVYGRISASAYTSLTTVTVELDSGALDAGISSVQYGIITPNNPSYIPSDYMPLTGGTFSGDIIVPNEAYDESTWDSSDAVATKDVIKNIVAAVGHNFIKGLTITCAGGDTAFSVAAGGAEAGTKIVYLSSSLAKTSASWVEGAGGALDTGSVAADTWYHVHLIFNPTTSTADILLSLSASSPTLPTDYTVSRRIGSVKTNSGDINFTGYLARGGDVRWKLPTTDGNVAYSTSEANKPVDTPDGIVVKASLQAVLSNSGTREIRLYSDGEDDFAIAGFDNVGAMLRTTASVTGAALKLDLLTDTSGNIKVRANAASTGLVVTTLGWYDFRGEV